MQIPQYWAQVRLRHETGIRHGATVLRWGWSDISQADAQSHAQQRAQQALEDVLKAPQTHHLDSDFERMEWTGEYGLYGSTPIREEVLERQNGTVMTRNNYGAHCLNTAQVAIADMDYPREKPLPGFPFLSMILMLLALPWLWLTPLVWSVQQIVLIVIIAATGLVFHSRLKQWLSARKTKQTRQASALDQAVARVQQAQANHPDWGLRVYETPKGLRVIVTHAAWAPQAPEVKTLFQELGADPVYALLCEKQQCFRARVSGKPWRMGISGLSTQARRWPVSAENLSARQEWCQLYEQKSERFAACRFLQQLGPSTFCLEAQAFVPWHDSASKAQSSLPLA